MPNNIQSSKKKKIIKSDTSNCFFRFKYRARGSKHPTIFFLKKNCKPD